MRALGFEGYARRIDGFDYVARRQDVPRDMAKLLELAEAIDLEDTIIVDREHYAE